MSELKPCPFCGGVAARDIILEDGSNYGGEIIVCKRCLASTRVFFGEKEGLEESWNTRTPAPAEVEELLERYESSWWLLGYEAASHEDYEISEENWAKMNALKSRLLAAFANTTPNLSGDVKGWLPIETAPKDGTRVKLLTQGGKEDIGYWSNYPRYNPDDFSGEWSTEFGNCDTPITHWMPLEMKYTPTAFTRDDARREAQTLYAIQDNDWGAFPENIQLSLMLDATILLLSRKLLEAK